MAETSMHSYHTILADLGDLQETVLDCIEENPGRNDRELTEILKLKGTVIERCSVIARRYELEKMGYIKCSGYATDHKTGRPAKLWEARQ
jgi:hypothetical protein